MDIKFKDKFIVFWEKYFGGAELPVAFYYSDTERAELAKAGKVSRCVIGAITPVRNGRSFTFDTDSIGCFGGKRYLGFAERLRPEFEYFLSCGVPGKMEGERYKKSPALVKEIMGNWPSFSAPKSFINFKRWDNLNDEDEPEVAVFFATPDVLSGLFTLANFDRSNPDSVFTPMGSGCSSIVSYPYREMTSENPRAVIGMFDPSARPFVPKNTLSFAVPVKRLIEMVDNIEESFLTTATWQTIRKRI